MMIFDALTLAGLFFAIVTIAAIYVAKTHCRRYGGC
jgi:membrane protein implicated in regulation of membrane protease activity